MNIEKFEAAGKEATLYHSKESGSPLIILNNYAGDGKSVMEAAEKLYLSLGDKEAKTRNQYLKPVQDNTERIAGHFRDAGIDVTFEMNPGNHFKDAALRSAKGILAII